MKIQPTVGRVVWHMPGEGDALKKFNDQPLAAMIAHVNEDGSVNLGVLDHKGQPHARASVRLVQEGDELVEGEGYAMWMPYQLGQAARTQQAESRVNPVLGAPDQTTGSDSTATGTEHEAKKD